jgi:dihydroneopterin aldolase
MKHKIEVNGIQLYAFHGCLPEEGQIGGHYIIDVSITTNFTPSFSSDELSDTVDYVAINKIVEQEMAIRSKLIEHVGHRIIERFKTELKGIQSTILKVTKLTPPIEGDVKNVAIVIEENF